MPISEVINCNNLDLMSTYPDGYFNLAIVDPPYGIDAANRMAGDRRKSGKGLAKKTKFKAKDWDKAIPDQAYFDELQRISKNQIIWGGNYMANMLKNSQCWVVWDKDNGTTKFADVELAWTSFDQAARLFKFVWNGMLQGDMKNKQERIHPTQKPIQLYTWLLMNFANPGDKILDTHLGSGSHRIAAYDLGFDFWGCEADEDHYNDQEKRFAKHKAQVQLWNPNNRVTPAAQQILL